MVATSGGGGPGPSLRPLGILGPGGYQPQTLCSPFFQGLPMSTAKQASGINGSLAALGIEN